MVITGAVNSKFHILSLFYSSKIDTIIFSFLLFIRGHPAVIFDALMITCDSRWLCMDGTSLDILVNRPYKRLTIKLFLLSGAVICEHFLLYSTNNEPKTFHTNLYCQTVHTWFIISLFLFGTVYEMANYWFLVLYEPSPIKLLLFLESHGWYFAESLLIQPWVTTITCENLRANHHRT